jgi:hypothetical protein
MENKSDNSQLGMYAGQKSLWGQCQGCKSGKRNYSKIRLTGITGNPKPDRISLSTRCHTQIEVCKLHDSITPTTQLNY